MLLYLKKSSSWITTNVTFHGKTYTNAFPLNLKLTPNERRANDFWERLNDLVNALNQQVKISNGFRKRSND